MKGPHIIWKRIDKIPPHPDNPKAHDIEALKASFRRFGFRSPIIITDKSGLTSEGHGRTRALLEMKAAGEDPPEGIGGSGGRQWAKGPWYAPCLVGMPPFDSPDDERAFLIASNRIVELGGWDDDAIDALISKLPKPNTVGLSDRLLKGLKIPSFQAGTSAGQSRLDQKSPIVCPNCKHEFVP